MSLLKGASMISNREFYKYLAPNGAKTRAPLKTNTHSKV